MVIGIFVNLLRPRRVFVQVIIRDLREIWLQLGDEEFSSAYLRHDYNRIYFSEHNIKYFRNL